MAGGKGKSSGGKSSGGKVGADGSKKQQSHSSKAGLQVSSSPPTTFTPPCPSPIICCVIWFSAGHSDRKSDKLQPRQSRVNTELSGQPQPPAHAHNMRRHPLRYLPPSATIKQRYHRNTARDANVNKAATLMRAFKLSDVVGTVAERHQRPHTTRHVDRVIAQANSYASSSPAVVSSVS